MGREVDSSEGEVRDCNTSTACVNTTLDQRAACSIHVFDPHVHLPLPQLPSLTQNILPVRVEYLDLLFIHQRNSEGVGRGEWKG